MSRYSSLVGPNHATRARREREELHQAELAFQKQQHLQNRAQRFDVYAQNDAARRARRYQQQDEQLAFDRQQELADQEFQQRRALQADEIAGRFGLQAGDIAGRYGLQAMEGAQRLEQGQQGYGFQTALGAQGQVYDLEKMGFTADVNTLAQQVLFAHQDLQQERGAQIQEQMAYVEADIAEISAQLDEVRKLREKEVDYGYDQQGSNATLGRMKELSSYNNQLAQQLKESESKLKQLEDDRKRAEDRRDATTAYLRKRTEGRYRDGRADQLAEQDRMYESHLNRQEQLAPGFQSGRYYYDQTQLDDIRLLQIQRNAEAAKRTWSDPDKAKINMDFDRKIWNILDSPLERPMNERVQTTLDMADASTVYEDLSTGKRYRESAPGRVPVNVTVDQNGQPSFDYGRNRPDPNSQQKALDDAQKKYQSDVDHRSSVIAKRDAWIKDHTIQTKTYDSDGYETGEKTEYRDNNWNSVAAWGMINEANRLFPIPQLPSSPGSPGVAPGQQSWNQPQDEAIRRATTPVPASSLQGGPPAQQQAGQQGGQGQQQPAVSPWKWEGTGEPPDVVAAKQMLTQQPVADPWKEMVNPGMGMVREFRQGQYDEAKAIVAQWEKEGTSPWIKKRQAMIDADNRNIPRFESADDVQAAAESGQLAPGSYVFVKQNGKYVKMRLAAD